MEVNSETSLKLDDNSSKKKTCLSWRKGGWKKYLQIFIAEICATALLLCLGCMGCIAGFGGTTSVHALQPAFVFGFAVCALITAFGHISGAHMNPAVTICLYMNGNINAALSLVYFVAEIFGAIIGVGILLLVTPTTVVGSKPVCLTIPDASLNHLQAAGVEFVMTTLLILVLMSCIDVRNSEKQDSVPLKFGATIITLSLLGGPYTGASLNPARSFAPALWSNEWSGQWVYWIGPLAAGILTPIFYNKCFPPD